MNEEMIEALISSSLGKPVFVYYTPPNTQQVSIAFSGDLIELPHKEDEQISYLVSGICTSVQFTAKSVEKAYTGVTSTGAHAFYIIFKTTEDWKRENA